MQLIVTIRGNAPDGSLIRLVESWRSVQQELKRRTIEVRVFPNEASLERLVSAVLAEIDDKWAANTKADIK